ncbi:hypothetical protein M8C13_40395 [Crossiella sp. SN42]|uniref:hypothetical protein n=1 Tax=Crossiella sp. SN42 TaxID=2944808 RepID=UPI00207CF680|nr:hypothetical protein [Crossiella sp. SN42]MCO1582028.1 hypothetical protein [Crossiella sp. SN42]
MALEITTQGTCRHCGSDLAQAVESGRTRHWVHYLTRLIRCASGETTAEPVTLEVVR